MFGAGAGDMAVDLHVAIGLHNEWYVRLECDLWQWQQDQFAYHKRDPITARVDGIAAVLSEVLFLHNEDLQAIAIDVGIGRQRLSVLTFPLGLHCFVIEIASEGNIFTQIGRELLIVIGSLLGIRVIHIAVGCKCRTTTTTTNK